MRTETNRHEFRTDPKCPPTYVYHTGTVGEREVVKVLIKHLKDPPARGHIILITHAIMPLMPYWADQNRIRVIVDEELGAVRHPESSHS